MFSYKILVDKPQADTPVIGITSMDPGETGQENDIVLSPHERYHCFYWKQYITKLLTISK
jgi:hypothetical protein